MQFDKGSELIQSVFHSRIIGGEMRLRAEHCQDLCSKAIRGKKTVQITPAHLTINGNRPLMPICEL